MPSFLSPGKYAAEGLYEGLMGAMQVIGNDMEKRADREALKKKSEEEKKRWEMEFALKAEEAGKTYNPADGTITDRPGGFNKKQAEKDLGELSKVYGSLTDDQKMSPEGQAIRNKMYSLVEGKLGGSQPTAPSASAGLMQSSPVPVETTPEASAPAAPVGLMAPREKFSLAPGQKTKKEQELDEYAAKKEIDENVSKTIPSTEVARLGSAEGTLKKIADMRKTLAANKDKFGPVAGRIGKFNENDVLAQTLNSQAEGLLQDAGTYLEGGKLAEGDIKKYRRIIGGLKSKPETFANSLDLLEKMVLDKQKADLDSYTKAGYKTKGFGKVKEGKIPEGLLGGLKKPEKVTDKEWNALSEEGKKRLVKHLGN